MTLSLRGKGEARWEKVLNWGVSLGAQNIRNLSLYLSFMETYCEALGLNFDALVAQSAHETADRKTGSIPWSSVAWVQGNNPAGIGITDSSNPLSTVFATGHLAARAHALHMYLYVHGDTMPPGFGERDDPRWFPAIRAGMAGVASTVGDLAGKWAVDPDYAAGIEKWHRAMQRSGLIGSGEEQEGTQVARYYVTWPGLPGGPIGFTFPVKLNIVPSWRTRQRPGIKARRVRRSVQHENGNLKAGARADSMYLYNGAGGRAASWHGSVDDVEGYINLPADEVGWHAGDGSGPGNMNGLAVELCQLAYTKGREEWLLAIDHAAEMMGRAAGARLDASPPHEQHNDYSSYGKNCPEKMRGKPTDWTYYCQRWLYWRDVERAEMAGRPAPGNPPAYGISDILAATVNLNLRRVPSLAGTPLNVIAAGSEFSVMGRDEVAEGYTWIPVSYQGTPGYVAQAGLDGASYVKLVKDNPDPVEYVAASPIPALLETDVHKEENVIAVATDAKGNEFTYVRDVIEFTKETVAGQYASDNPLPVHEPFKAGDRAIAAWICRNTDGKHFYVLAGGDDEWVRVPVANTKWIADAPLQGDDEVQD